MNDQPRTGGCGCGSLILIVILIIVASYWGIVYLLPWLARHIVLFNMIAEG